MKDLHTFGWYAARISPHLPAQVFQPVPARLWGGLAYLLVSLAGILTIGLLDLHPGLNLLIALVLGLSFAGKCFLGHEILHGTVVRRPWLRDFLGAIAFFPMSTGPGLWRKWHNVTHHVHTQHDVNDPDAWSTLEQLMKRPLLSHMYRLPRFVRSTGYFSFLTINFSFVATRNFFVNLKNFEAKKRPLLWMQFLIPWGTWIGLLFMVGLEKWIFAYLIPALIANFILSAYIATNHNLNPLTAVNDPLANSLSVRVPKWVDVLHFNFSYHAEHHLFPGISPKYYPLVKEHILKMWPERYHSMSFGKAMLALWKTPRIYKTHEDLVDPIPGNLYPTIGYGLDTEHPEQVSYRAADVEAGRVEKKANAEV
ncbi:fatty acid desaturase family protein [Brevibacillus dissolubilis]|uniref:fatty acid desaturase family protein n=1 Tax=Brevibacillus dissolubilis TaxID=1844116 RepID=UPI001117319D|nr:acyl-CoA desaturase [Brevibacillus dissolubilis]